MKSTRLSFEIIVDLLMFFTSTSLESKWVYQVFPCSDFKQDKVVFFFQNGAN